MWGWSLTLGKVEDLESSGTPEGWKLDSKAQNTLHWGVLGVIRKGLKRRYRKWPRIDHLDICSPSYGQKKGQESNSQFDSWPLKVGNRPLPDIRFDWKDLDEGYNFGSDLVTIGLYSRKLWPFKVPKVTPRQFRDSISGVPRIWAIWMYLYIWSAHYAHSARGWGLFDHQKGSVVRGCFSAVRGCSCWPFSLFVTFCYFFLLFVTFINYFLLLKQG